MPLVNIHLIKGQRSPLELRKLADIVHQCILQSFNAPPGDRYQVSTFLPYRPLVPYYFWDPD